MPSWNQVLIEIQECKRIDALDFTRRKYLKELHDITGRNIIAYYSGWLQKSGISAAEINDDDKNGFMNAIYGLDRNRGLDLILHTPGGNIAATESIVNYLHKMFNDNIRVIIPQLAMSAGTMIACASKEIIMGKQSNIGPIDPQYGGVSTYAVIEEFNKALEEIKKDPRTIPAWQIVISKYHPTFIGECEKAKIWASEMVKRWLATVMFKADNEAEVKAQKVVEELSDHEKNKNHSRHIDSLEAIAAGLKISPLETENIILENGEKEDIFQDCVLTIHHSYMHTFSNSTAHKIIENHEGKAIVFRSQQNAPVPVPLNIISPVQFNPTTNDN